MEPVTMPVGCRADFSRLTSEVSPVKVQGTNKPREALSLISRKYSPRLTESMRKAPRESVTASSTVPLRPRAVVSDPVSDRNSLGRRRTRTWAAGV
jgi:hypothetical protein